MQSVKYADNDDSPRSGGTVGVEATQTAEQSIYHKVGYSFNETIEQPVNHTVGYIVNEISE
jgi:hypothetical protein